MALASSGATLPIFRCRAWLNWLTRVAGLFGMAGSSVSLWQARQTCFDGSRLSCTLVLVAAEVWHSAQPSPIPRWMRCEKGAALHAAPHANNTRTAGFNPYFPVSLRVAE